LVGVDVELIVSFRVKQLLAKLWCGVVKLETRDEMTALANFDRSLIVLDDLENSEDGDNQL